jgi:hypothetical protein
MRAYVFVDGSNDELATILHETCTGEVRAFGLLTRHSRACIHDGHRSVWHRRSWFAFFRLTASDY